MDDDPRSVNSPRRVLSFSRNRRGPFLVDPDDNSSSSRIGVSGEHGPKPSEVYGFVGSITTVVATVAGLFLLFCFQPFMHSTSQEILDDMTYLWYFLVAIVELPVIFLTWAYVPDSWLHFIGIFYYPDRYWALALPTYAMVTVFLAVAFYIGLNFMITLPPTSLNTIFDDCSREPLSFETVEEGGEEELPIEPISDVGIDQINNLMFKQS